MGTRTRTGIDVVDAAPADALDGDARTVAEAEAGVELRRLARSLDRANVVALVTSADLRQLARGVAANAPRGSSRAAHLARLAVVLDLGAADADLVNGVDGEIETATITAPGGEA